MTTRIKGENEYQIFGIPGAGKTTTLSKAVENAASQVGGENLIISSFTRAAAQELVSRDLPVPDQNIGTLHSLCYRALGTPPLAEKHIKQFNEEHPRCALSSKQHIDLDDEAQDGPQDEDQIIGDSDVWFQQYNVNRSRMIPEEKWSERVAFFAKRWEQWKQENGYVDFTDMIYICYRDAPYPPGAPLIGIFDEAQDFTPLQLALIRSWAAQLRYILVAGDDDQCQPAGTMVETTKGPKPIEELKPHQDRLLSYSRNDAQIYGSKKRGYSFSLAVRNYNGPIYSVHVGDKRTRCTEDHLWLVRWSDWAKQSKICCVYLMQKDDRFRVGWCQLFRSDKTFHLGIRVRLERADKVWILSTFEDRWEASAYESVVAAKYGIPTIMFEGTEAYSDNFIDYVFDHLDSEKLKNRATYCVWDHGGRVFHPFLDFTKERNKHGASIFKVRACNLINSLMEIPVYQGHKTPKWETASVGVFHDEGDVGVYSLSVEKYHTYIADGIVTHNCIYGFTGADPSVFLDENIPESRKRVLNHSFRCPRAVQDHARWWIEKINDRESKEQYPRQENGEEVLGRVDRIPYKFKEETPVVDFIERSLDRMEDNQEVMVLTSCSYMLSPLIKEMRRRGLPFGNRYKKRRGDWNPLRLDGKKKTTPSRLISYLEPQGPMFQGKRLWTAQQLSDWIDLCSASGLLYKGAKERIHQAANEDISKKTLFELIANSFKPEKLDQALQLQLSFVRNHILATKEKAFQFPECVIRRRGIEELKRRPRITVGTIHSVKGGQADHVLLFPDISYGAAQFAEAGDEGKRAVIRQFYVAMTRAKERLTIGRPKSNLYINV